MEVTNEFKSTNTVDLITCMLDAFVGHVLVHCTLNCMHTFITRIQCNPVRFPFVIDDAKALLTDR